jgi:hypothetical protein
MVEGKNRVRVDWVDGYGHPKTQIFPNTVKAEAAEGLFYLYVEENDEVLVAIGVPLQRLIRFAALKNEEVSSDAGQDGESAEDSQVCDSSDA